jgi:hypothetical protein
VAIRLINLVGGPCDQERVKEHTREEEQNRHEKRRRRRVAGVIFINKNQVWHGRHVRGLMRTLTFCP